MPKWIILVAAALIGALGMRFARTLERSELPAKPPLTLPHSPVKKGEWLPLFTPDSFKGWRMVGGGKWRIDDAVVVLENDAAFHTGYLASELHARDFDARFDCKIPEGDSGFLFRSRTQPHNPADVIGPQVQLNRGEGRGMGGLFELQARGWLCRVDAALQNRLIASDDWLRVEVEARAQHVVVRINGETTVDFTDDAARNPYAESGFFAWQIHGGGPCRILIRSAEVRVHD